MFLGHGRGEDASAYLRGPKTLQRSLGINFDLILNKELNTQLDCVKSFLNLLNSSQINVFGFVYAMARSKWSSQIFQGEFPNSVLYELLKAFRAFDIFRQGFIQFSDLTRAVRADVARGARLPRRRLVVDESPRKLLLDDSFCEKPFVSSGFMPTECLLFLNRADKTSCVLDLHELRTLCVLRGFRKPALCLRRVTVADHLLAAAAADSTVSLWDMRDGQCLYTKRVAEPQCTLLFLPRFGGMNDVLIGGGLSGVLTVWQVSARPVRLELLHSIRKHVAAISAFSSVPQYGAIVSASVDHTLRVWDATSSRELRGHEGGVLCVAHAEGGVFISGGRDGNVLVWDLSAPAAPVATLRGHETPVVEVICVPETNVLISVGGNGEICAWDLERRELVQRFQSHLYRGQPLAGAFYHRAARKLVLVTKELLSFDVTAHEKSSRPSKHPILTLSFSPWTGTLTALTHEGLQFWDVATGTPLPQRVSAAELVGEAVTFTIAEEGSTALIVGTTGRCAVVGTQDSTQRCIIPKVTNDEIKIGSTSYYSRPGTSQHESSRAGTQGLGDPLIPSSRRSSRFRSHSVGRAASSQSLRADAARALSPMQRIDAFSGTPESSVLSEVPDAMRYPFLFITNSSPAVFWICVSQTAYLLGARTGSELSVVRIIPFSWPILYGAASSAHDVVFLVTGRLMSVFRASSGDQLASVSLPKAPAAIWAGRVFAVLAFNPMTFVLLALRSLSVVAVFAGRCPDFMPPRGLERTSPTEYARGGLTHAAARHAEALVAPRHTRLASGPLVKTPFLKSSRKIIVPTIKCVLLDEASMALAVVDAQDRVITWNLGHELLASLRGGPAPKVLTAHTFLQLLPGNRVAVRVRRRKDAKFVQTVSIPELSGSLSVRLRGLSWIADTRAHAVSAQPPGRNYIWRRFQLTQIDGGQLSITNGAPPSPPLAMWDAEQPHATSGEFFRIAKSQQEIIDSLTSSERALVSNDAALTAGVPPVPWVCRQVLRARSLSKKAPAQDMRSVCAVPGAACFFCGTADGNILAVGHDAELRGCLMRSASQRLATTLVPDDFFRADLAEDLALVGAAIRNVLRSIPLRGEQTSFASVAFPQTSRLFGHTVDAPRSETAELKASTGGGGQDRKLLPLLRPSGSRALLTASELLVRPLAPNLSRGDLEAALAPSPPREASPAPCSPRGARRKPETPLPRSVRARVAEPASPRPRPPNSSVLLTEKVALISRQECKTAAFSEYVRDFMRAGSASARASTSSPVTARHEPRRRETPRPHSFRRTESTPSFVRSVSSVSTRERRLPSAAGNPRTPSPHPRRPPLRSASLLRRRVRSPREFSLRSPSTPGRLRGARRTASCDRIPSIDVVQLHAQQMPSARRARTPKPSMPTLPHGWAADATAHIPPPPTTPVVS
eukprot:gnl/Chilomastix_cuspidata/4212.p1 GENE.gnl/Chilomastix_cuspidata/4212~~gnl/Chilomastix_cuspidata/4212.p1  ORF type:complete len:1411 (+),score=274.87 gnl/Chilomastix_cuspidata/4212:191-4423(+)